jgi:hypothetical protein
MKKIILAVYLFLLVFNAKAQTVSYGGRATSSVTVNLSLTISGSFKVSQQQQKDLSDNPVSYYNIAYQLFPNPAQNDITLTLKADNKAIFNLAIYDVTGKLKDQLKDVSLQTGSYTHTFNTSGFMPGNYFLKITSKDGLLYKSIPFTKQ